MSAPARASGTEPLAHDHHRDGTAPRAGRSGAGVTPGAAPDGTAPAPSDRSLG